MAAPLHPIVTLYTRPGCHLCDDAREILDALLAERVAAGSPAVDIVEVDIESDPALFRRHLETIPVLAVGAAELPLAMRPGAIRAFLAERLAPGGTAPSGTHAG